MELSLLSPATLLRKLREYTNKLTVRVVIMGLMAFVALGLAQLADIFVPDKIAESLDGAAADRLLQIIANAMLAVTTFSLTVMVTVYSASSSQWTPRVHRLIMQDRTTQNTLAVFIGAYLYALVAIILRELDVFDDKRAFVLFVMTGIVLAVIIIYIVRWVVHLQTFGRLSHVGHQIEETTQEQFRERLENPCFGASAFTGDAPEGARPILAPESGYIQYIYPEALNEVAENHGVTLYLMETIGHFSFMHEPLVMVVEGEDGKGEEFDWDSLEEAVLSCITQGDMRSFDQDPRFGLVVLGEVGSKALSPGVNDPGTAIDVLTRAGRILSLYKDEVDGDRDKPLGALYVPPLDPADLIEDGFGAIARDGAGVVEVQQHLQSVLAGLMNHPDEKLADAAKKAAARNLARARAVIGFPADLELVENSAAEEIRRAADDF